MRQLALNSEAILDRVWRAEMLVHGVVEFAGRVSGRNTGVNERRERPSNGRRRILKRQLVDAGKAWIDSQRGNRINVAERLGNRIIEQVGNLILNEGDATAHAIISYRTPAANYCLAIAEDFAPEPLFK